MSIDSDNLRKVASEGKGLLRIEILEAMEAAAIEIERLTCRVERAEAELAALDKSHTDLGRKLAGARREIERLRAPQTPWTSLLGL